MSLDEKKEMIEQLKRTFESKLENTYVIKAQNGMTCIHEKKVNRRAECNLLHDILNPPKCTNLINSHYFPIIHICMNTQEVRAKFHNFLILLDSGYSSTIDMGRLI